MKTDAELFLTNLFYGLAGATNETVVQMTVSLVRMLTGAICFHKEEDKGSLTFHMHCLDRRRFLCPPTRHR